MSSRLYFDYAATTPLDPRVLEAMVACLEEGGAFGNPASRHLYGVAAAKKIELARYQIEKAIQASPGSLVFTSGATEANNLAIKGIAEFHQRRGNHIVTCQTDHPAVLDPCRYLERHGYEVTYLKPTREGLVDLNALEAALKEKTLLVTTVYVNSETGIIQPVAEIVKLAHERGVYCHIDAAQAVGKLPVDVQALDVDLLSLSAHKAYGPKGIGALYVKQQPRVRLTAQMQGGGHQHGLRSGTLPTHQIVGMGKAFELAADELAADGLQAELLRKTFWEALQPLGGIFLNVPLEKTVPHILNLYFEKIANQALLEALDSQGMAVSTGSACTSGSLEPSYVLTGMGIPREIASNSLRLSWGRFSTKSDVEEAVQIIQKIRVNSPLTLVGEGGPKGRERVLEVFNDPLP